MLTPCPRCMYPVCTGLPLWTTTAPYPPVIMLQAFCFFFSCFFRRGLGGGFRGDRRPKLNTCTNNGVMFVVFLANVDRNQNSVGVVDADARMKKSNQDQRRYRELTFFLPYEHKEEKRQRPSYQIIQVLVSALTIDWQDTNVE